MTELQTLTLADMHEGRTASFTVTVTPEDIDAFARLTGDVSPLHMDARFARSRGFERRVCHGALLIGYISRAFGVHLPGANCLLQSVKTSFNSPAYEGDVIEVKATVTQVVESVNVIVAAVTVTHAATGRLILKGQVQAGFTSPVAEGA